MAMTGDMWIKLTSRQVYEVMTGLINDLQEEYPDSEQAEQIAETLTRMNDRAFIKLNVMPRIKDHTDVNWLEANQIRYWIKSSISQFSNEHMIRIYIPDPEARQAYRDWLAS
jgi:hypothetical protein